MMKTNIQIENLKCGGCAATIKKGIIAVKGVEDVTIDIENSIVTISSETSTLDEVKAKLSKLGYPEVGSENTLVHKAKSFVSCAVGRIES